MFIAFNLEISSQKDKFKIFFFVIFIYKKLLNNKIEKKKKISEFKLKYNF